jgi:hypothetical protein
MAVVEAATIPLKVGMMIASKPGLIVHVAVAVSLAVVGPVTLRRPAVLATGLLVRLTIFLILVRTGRPLLIPIGGVGPVLFLLRLLLAVHLLLFLFGRFGWMLLRRLGVLLVFGSLILLSERGSENSQREGQSPHRHQSDWFHTFNDPLHCDHLWRMQMPMVGVPAVWLLFKIADLEKGLYIAYR